MFGSNEFSATVQKSRLLNVSITGQMAVGGVVGQNMGTITEVYASGSVIATDSGAGGIVGLQLSGSLSNVSFVQRRERAADLCRRNCRDEHRRHIAALCDRARERRQHVGGLVGYLGTSAAQSYATGAVSGTSDVGGLVRGIDGYSILRGRCSYSYTTGQSCRSWS